jgi:hypothetical protein
MESVDMLFARLESMPRSDAAPIVAILATAAPRHIMQALNELIANRPLSVDEYDARLKLVPGVIRRMELAS